jgi:hypothetical protein
MLAGVQVDVPSGAEWGRVWEACEYATFFQSPTWARIWEQATDGRVRACPERLTFADGRRAILPLCQERRALGLLSRRVASPQGTFGGWLSEQALDLEHARVLLERLLDPAKSLVWRMNPYDTLALAVGAERELPCKADETHALDLTPGPEALLQGFRNGYKNDIRRARRTGRINIEPATTLDDWRAYFLVYQDTLSRWGLTSAQGYPWRLFEVMAELQSPHITLWLARVDGDIVSGELCMYARRHAVSWHAATTAAALRTNVAKVQIYHVIEDAFRRGCRWFDFNPSAGLNGVREFKESFAAQALPAPIVYVDARPKRWVRALASRCAVPYATLELTSLREVLAQNAAAGAQGELPRAKARGGAQRSASETRTLQAPASVTAVQVPAFEPREAPRRSAPPSAPPGK